MKITSEWEGGECRIKKGWHDEGKKGKVLAVVQYDARTWAVVVWEEDSEREPELFKGEALEVAETKFVSLV